MTRIAFLICLLSVFLGFRRSCFGNDMEPQVHFMLGGATQLIQDMQSVMSLTSQKQQEQTKNIKNYLDMIFKGMSFDRLMRMDLIFGDGPVRYRPAFPLEDEKILWTKNLIPNGIQKKRRVAGALCSTQGAFVGFLRIRDQYAIFAEKREDLPVKAPPPDEELAHLAKLTHHAAMELINDPDGTEARRKSYNNKEKGLRKELAKQIKKLNSETQETYDLRKLAFDQQLDELELLYVEAEYSRTLAYFDQATKTMSMDFELKPIPATVLAKSIQNLNQAPQSFANVPKAPKSNMSLRVRFPLDQMRQRHLTEMLELLRNISHKKADKNQTRTAEQKAAAEEVIDLSFALLLNNVKGGMADGFFESHPNPAGTHTAISGFQAVDGNAPLAILNLLEKCREGQKVTLNLAEENGVKIHSFLMSEKQFPGFREFFGSDTVYVGTSPETIWMGAGPKAVEELQAAIREVAKPNTGKAEDPFFTISGRLTPWLELQQKSYPDSGNKTFQDICQMLIEAGKPGDDRFSAWMNRKANDMVGKWSAEPGWARFLGIYLADFSKKNL